MRHAGFAAILAWIASLTNLLGGISAIRSNARLSADGKRLLVMVSPDVDYEKRVPTTFTFPDGQSIVLNATFTKSGSYDATTLAPIWRVDWFSLDDDLFYSPDFSDVVRVNRFGLDSDWALAFYHDGRLTRRYSCRDLLTCLRSEVFLPFTSWDWHYEWYEGFQIRNDHFIVSTARRRLLRHEFDLGLQESYTFDLRTGAMTSRSTVDWWRLWWVDAAVASLSVAVLCGIWLWGIRRQTPIRKGPSENATWILFPCVIRYELVGND